MLHMVTHARAEKPSSSKLSLLALHFCAAAHSRWSPVGALRLYGVSTAGAQVPAQTARLHSCLLLTPDLQVLIVARL